MALEKSLVKIKGFILGRYKNNLAGLLVFGTANTGEFGEGKSDMDTMIFLKQIDELNLDEETKFLIEALKSERFATQYFHTLESIKDYIKRRTSFSSYITILSEDGSRVLYITPEFEKTKKYLRENSPSKDAIKKYVQEKDKTELDGYFKEREDFDLTKALFAHLRRKLQILNYFQNKELVFDYKNCLNNAGLSDNERKSLEKLYDTYKNRRGLSDKETENYHTLAKQLTNKILKE